MFERVTLREDGSGWFCWGKEGSAVGKEGCVNEFTCLARPWQRLTRARAAARGSGIPAETKVCLSSALIWEAARSACWA